MYISGKYVSASYFLNIFIILFCIFFSGQLFAKKMNVAMLTYISGKVEIINSEDREADFGVDVYTGDIITTSKNASFMLTFYDGCRQESVNGNSTIKVGKHRSSIIKGRFTKVDKFDCEIPRAELAENDSYKKAGINFRGDNSLLDTNKIKYQQKITSFCLTNNDKLSIKKLKQQASALAYNNALVLFINESTKANLASLNHNISQQLLQMSVKDFKVLKYSQKPNEVCAKVSVVANAEELQQAYKIVQQSSIQPKISYVQNSDNPLQLKLWTNRRHDPYFRDDENIFIYFVSNEDVYLKLDYFMSDGTVAHLIPNILSGYNKIKAGKLYTLGGKNSEIDLVASPPYGKEEIRAIIKKDPFSSYVQASEVVDQSAEYERLLSKHLSQHSAKNKFVNVSFELISTP
ncbi:MAG: DUF4384 domain-containing protein [Pseudomonadota bacterium]